MAGPDRITIRTSFVIAGIALIPSLIIGLGAIIRAEYVTSGNKDAIHSMQADQKDLKTKVGVMQSDVNVLKAGLVQDRQLQKEVRDDVKLIQSAVIKMQTDVSYLRQQKDK